MINHKYLIMNWTDLEGWFLFKTPLGVKDTLRIS